MINLLILNRVEARNHIPGENAICIRMTDHDKEFVTGFPFDKYVDVMEVRFMDSDPEYLFTDALKKLLLTKENAEQIFTFIEKNINAFELVIHCDYGQSRSAVVAKFIADYYFDEEGKEYWNQKIKENTDSGKFIPNEWIASELVRHFKER